MEAPNFEQYSNVFLLGVSEVLVLVLFCSVLFCSVLFCSVLFCSVLFYDTDFFFIKTVLSIDM